MKRERLVELLRDDDKDLTLLDGPEFDPAILGICERYGQPRVVCYDYTKVIKVLKRQGMTDEEAQEWFEFNIIGAWMGDTTPVFLHRLQAVKTAAMTTYLRRACDKLCYPSEGAANTARKAAGKRRRTQSWKGRLTIYHCKTCRAWHLGHQ